MQMQVGVGALQPRSRAVESGGSKSRIVTLASGAEGGADEHEEAAEVVLASLAVLDAKLSNFMPKRNLANLDVV